MKFKKGDIIKGTKDNDYSIANEYMYKAEVLRVEADSMKIKILEHKNKYMIGETYDVENNDDRFTKITKITKQDLLDMPLGTKIITDKKGHNVFIKVEEGEFDNDDGEIIRDYYINDDLTLDDTDYGNKINRIEEPMYKIVYENNDVKEMTIAEISEALGYEVKIIKEE